MVTVSVVDGGWLEAPTGRLVATDPFTMPDRAPFWRTVEPGLYPVSLSVAQWPNGFSVIAAVRIRILETEPARWVLATTPDQDRAALERGELLGFPVDSGTAAVMDRQAAGDLRRRLSLLPGIPDLAAVMQIGTAMEANSPAAPWANLELDAPGRNVVIFTSGFGDGVYAAYWGFDDRGKAASLVVDLDIVSGEPFPP